MNLLSDVRLQQWEIDQILRNFYAELKQKLCLCDDENCEGYSIRSVELLYLLEHHIVKYIAYFASESTVEV